MSEIFPYGRVTANCTNTLPPKPGKDNDIFEVCPVAQAFEMAAHYPPLPSFVW